MTTLHRFESIQSERAAERLAGVLQRTELLAAPFEVEGLELRLKLECQQETGSFKTRGAWNQISQLTPAQREAGVVATSSGNHGKALSWAAQRAGVKATIFMPADAYPNKIEACREYDAEVILGESREAAEEGCAERVRGGAVLIHPYDDPRTVEGAGTVGLEIAQDWPEVDVVVLPVGGGGLLSGSSLALRRALGDRIKVVGVEPAGAASMSRGLEAGEPVTLSEITTSVQGLCPLNSGKLNIAIAGECVDRVFTVEDAAVFEAQARLVNEGGLVVEPAGAATSAFVLGGGLPPEWSEGLGRPLRVAIVVSGGNPAPEQLAEIRARSTAR